MLELYTIRSFALEKTAILIMTLKYMV